MYWTEELVRDLNNDWDDYPTGLSCNLRHFFERAYWAKPKRLDIFEDSFKYYVPKKGDERWEEFSTKYNQCTSYEQFQEQCAEIMENVFTDYLSFAMDFEVETPKSVSSLVRGWEIKIGSKNKFKITNNLFGYPE